MTVSRKRMATVVVRTATAPDLYMRVSLVVHGLARRPEVPVAFMNAAHSL